MKKSMGLLLPWFIMSGCLESTLDNKVHHEPMSKKCLICGKEHFGNNSFCSKECCVKFRTDKQKGGGV